MATRKRKAKTVLAGNKAGKSNNREYVKRIEDRMPIGDRERHSTIGTHAAQVPSADDPSQGGGRFRHACVQELVLKAATVANKVHTATSWLLVAHFVSKLEDAYPNLLQRDSFDVPEVPLGFTLPELTQDLIMRVANLMGSRHTSASEARLEGEMPGIIQVYNRIFGQHLTSHPRGSKPPYLVHCDMNIRNLNKYYGIEFGTSCGNYNEDVRVNTRGA
mmetsp:Transcript_7411/g.13375  ORF Transcript_7411/g.13375 Transcript_7411/m.13375 type:complete len:218 (+) Transcript_7411:1873-2526(+)